MRLVNAIPTLRMFAALPGKGDPLDFCFRHPIRPVQVRWEFEQLASLVRDLKPKGAMEIGTHNGGTLYTLCRLADPAAIIISLDLPRGRFGGGYHPLKIPIYRRFAGPRQRLHLVRDDSHSDKTREHIRGLLNGQQLDYLFIDGDHTYEGVKQDFEMYSPFVRRGGVVAFHDIAEHFEKKDCQVHRFWNEIRYSFRSREFIEDKAQGWAGIGVLTV